MQESPSVWLKWKSDLDSCQNAQELEKLVEALKWPGIEGAKKADVWAALMRENLPWTSGLMEKLVFNYEPGSSKGWLWVLEHEPTLTVVRRWGYLNTLNGGLYTHAGRFARKAWPVEGATKEVILARKLAEMLVEENPQRPVTYGEYRLLFDKLVAGEEAGGEEVMEVFLTIAQDGWDKGVRELVTLARDV